MKPIGQKPHRELGDWYRAADVFTLPSLSEGVPCVLLEALACNAPFVATRVGGIPEIETLGEGQLVPPADPKALAEALRQRLLDNTEPMRRDQVRTHAKAAAELADFLACVNARPQETTFSVPNIIPAHS